MKLPGHLQISGTLTARNFPGSEFYGISVKQSDGLAAFKDINLLSFEASSFYITQNDPNTDEVQVNFRGTTDGGGGSGTVTSVTFSDGVNTHSSTTTPKLNFSGDDFYLSTDLSGNAVANVKTVRRALLEKTSTQSISSGGNTIVTWNVEHFDIGGWADLGSSNTIFTVPSGVSLVKITVQLRWEGQGTGDNTDQGRRIATLLKNGSQLSPSIGSQVSGEGADQFLAPTCNFTSYMIPVQQGDTFSVQASQTNPDSSSLNVDDQLTWFYIEEVF